MAYKIFLSGELLPTPPDNIQLKIKNQNKTINLIDGTEINLLKQPALTEIKLSMLLPSQKYPFVHEGAKPPKFYLQLFERLKLAKKAFQLVIIRDSKSFNTSIRASLEEYDIIEDAALGQDIKINLSFKQFIDFGTKTLKSEELRPQDTAPEIPKSYTVKTGDTLWLIAKRFYDNGERYKDIYNLNKDIIKDPNWIVKGQVLRLPL